MFDQLSYIAAFLGGILSFISPCVLPLVPGYVSFIAGVRIEDVEKTTPVIRTKLFISSLFFVSGFSLVFISLGAGASAITPFLNEYNILLARIAAIIIMVFGLHMIGVFRIKLLYREFRVAPEISEAGGIVMPFLLGIAFGLGWTPCIGPILAGILILASAQETIGQGMVLLFLYAAGMGIPFLLAALSLVYFQKKSNWLKMHLGLIEKISGFFLILTGFFIFTGSLQSFGSFLLDYFPFLAELG